MDRDYHAARTAWLEVLYYMSGAALDRSLPELKLEVQETLRRIEAHEETGSDENRTGDQSVTHSWLEFSAQFVGGLAEKSQSRAQRKRRFVGKGQCKRSGSQRRG